jgi:hypothetical protein
MFDVKNERDEHIVSFVDLERALHYVQCKKLGLKHWADPIDKGKLS